MRAPFLYTSLCPLEQSDPSLANMGTEESLPYLPVPRETSGNKAIDTGK